MYSLGYLLSGDPPNMIYTSVKNRDHNIILIHFSTLFQKSRPYTLVTVVKYLSKFHLKNNFWKNHMGRLLLHMDVNHIHGYESYPVFNRISCDKTAGC